ncbi:MAG: 16S rRNA (guanine(527)-N(7))-methyltransferase RsmG [Synergistaceae bacterium]|jgi:16S rRNA (guanine527-N7)-methyltransferase|nr:16S rRNA (guanine(527)-N(7))-methyltransferase RsmG [Synergistaceae bacterium]
MESAGDIGGALKRYAELLSASNARARLTGPADPEVILGELVADALHALPWLEKFPSASRFADVGTGGGLPGIVWAICRPDMAGVLIDSVGKKISIVKEIAESLNLSNVTAVNARSEDFARSARESFDIATARAVADARVLAEYLSPLVRTGGRLIAFKGRNAANELDVPEAKWKILGLGPPSLARYSVMGKELNLVIWEKISECPKRFPRRPGEARKKPWHQPAS